MKKQVFILILLAFFAGTFAFGQAVHVDDPILVNCATAGPLFPIAGMPYTYEVAFNPTGGLAYWYSTISTSFMAGDVRSATEQAIGGTYVSAASPDYRVSSKDSTKTWITWNSKGLTTAIAAGVQPALFVVVEYTAPASGCANNMKVIPIRPIDAFTVDIMNLSAADSATALAYAAPDSSCFDKIRSADWIAGAGDGLIDYNFGTNVLFYEVVAANFSGRFTPSFRITGLQATQTAKIDWGYSKGAFPHSVGAVVNGTPVTTPAPDSTYTNVTNTSLGVSIFVRVTIENDDFEGLAATTYSLAVDAVNRESSIDVVNSTCINPGTADYVDIATQVLKPRPTITPVTPTLFIPNK